MLINPSSQAIDARPILIVGGAGFIGSHMVLALKSAGYQPIVLDNLATGHRHAVLGAELIVGEMNDKNLLEKLFAQYHFAAVMHFAAFIEVAESVKNPGKYYQNNVAATLQLLDTMIKYKVRHFIFSSTAAVYGEPLYTPIDEVHPLAPINPYGRSKYMVEQIIQDYAQSNELNYAILRYFNAAGADPLARIGECHEPESHLIPLVLQTAAGLREHITIYGRDYPTFDGTCVRDYVHVSDLCTAHLLALNALFNGKKQLIYNLGNGLGFSVQQVIDTARKVTGCIIPTTDSERRPGDGAVLVAEASLAKRELRWQPKYNDLAIIIDHAWQFLRKRIAA